MARSGSDPIGPWFSDELRRIVGSAGRAAAASPPPSFLEWASRVPEPKSGALDLDRFPYQRELYSDPGAEEASITVMKSTQVGASCWLVRWTLYWADIFGLTALYLFPAERQMADFSRHRVAPLLRCDYLAPRVGPAQINNVAQKQVGDGWLYLRGSQAEAGLESVDADLLAFDEYDLIPERSAAVAMRRLSSALSKGLVRSVGWPSVDGYGIAELFDRSDRRRWFVRCPGCRTRQFLRFYQRGADGDPADGLPGEPSAFVDPACAEIRCGKCTGVLDPRVIAAGEWVAEFPDRPERGYHVHRLLVPGIDLRQLIAESQADSPWRTKLFFNRDLGEPYSPEEGRLSLQAIQAAQSRFRYFQGAADAGYAGDNLVTMGVDVATTRGLHVRISEHVDRRREEKKALFIGKVDSFDDLYRLMELYGVHLCAIDHLPEGRLARALAEQHAGRVYLVSLAGPAQHDVLRVEDDDRRASVRRVEAMQATADVIRQQRNLLPQDLPEGYVSHLRAPVWFAERDDLGKITFGFRSTGADDYYMAEVFDLVATELCRYRLELEDLNRVEITTLWAHYGIPRTSISDDYYHEGPAEGFAF